MPLDRHARRFLEMLAYTFQGSSLIEIYFERVDLELFSPDHCVL